MRRTLLALTIVVLSAITSLGIIGFFAPPAPFFSPLTDSKVFGNTTPSPKMVYGFLPYWNTKKLYHSYSELTHAGIFSLTPEKDGTIDKTIYPASFLLPRLSTLLPHTHQEIVITAQTTELIQSLINQPDHQQNLIKDIIALTTEYSLEGVNIDFEPDTPVDENTAKNFTLFIAALDKELERSSPEKTLSIDTYANAASGGKIWQLKELEPYTDYFIIMAYDYHRPSSTITGPVAPLYGAALDRWSTDITQNLAQLVQIIPSQKLLLGLAFYGYQWQTVDENPTSQTYPKTGQTTLYHEIVELLKEPGVTNNWDRDALTPFLNFTKEDKTYQLHYEDPQSISLKLDLVNQSDLGGIAIWALGYEGEDEKMWQAINEKVSSASISATQSHLP